MWSPRGDSYVYYKRSACVRGKRWQSRLCRIFQAFLLCPLPVVSPPQEQGLCFLLSLSGSLSQRGACMWQELRGEHGEAPTQLPRLNCCRHPEVTDPGAVWKHEVHDMTPQHPVHFPHAGPSPQKPLPLPVTHLILTPSLCSGITTFLTLRGA